MTGVPGDGVRPTKRCLDDLRLSLPTIDVSLESIDDSIVRRAQSVPEQVAAGGAERVRSIVDRVMLKVRASTRRAAVHELRVRPTDCDCSEAAQTVAEGIGHWWIVAAGERQDDTPTRDFYARLEDDYGAHGSSHYLLPCVWDWRRLSAEYALALTDAVHREVRQAAYLSMIRGAVMQLALPDLDAVLRVFVRADNGTEAYIAISGIGVYNAKIIALLLSSFPEIDSSEWLPEPDGPALVKPSHGEILRSALLPADVAARLMDEFGGE